MNFSEIDLGAVVGQGSVSVTLIGLLIFGLRSIITGGLIPRRQHDQQITFMTTELTAARTAYENERTARKEIETEFVAYVKTYNARTIAEVPPQSNQPPNGTVS